MAYGERQYQPNASKAPGGTLTRGWKRTSYQTDIM
jgi:hypothetical protein